MDKETLDPKLLMLAGDISSGLLVQCREERILGVDIETSGLDWKKDSISTVQLYLPDANIVAILKSASGITPDHLISLLEDSSITKVFHHALFDLRFLASSWPLAPRNIACTKIASKIINPGGATSEHSLAGLLETELGVAIDKSEQTSNWMKQSFTTSQLRYLSNDVLYLPRLIAQLLDKSMSNKYIEDIRCSFQYIPTRLSTDLRECGDIFTY